jgi:hypothetical protein
MTGADPPLVAPEQCKDAVLDLLAAVLIEMLLEERRRTMPALTSELSRSTDLPCHHEDSRAS